MLDSRRTATAALLAGATALCGPAAASAAVTVTELKPCYLSVAPGMTEPVSLDAAGFTPGSLVDVRVDGATDALQATAGPTGRLSTQVRAPFRKHGERRFEIELVERDQPINAAVLQTRVSALAVRVRPATARPARRVRWIGRGFTAPGAVYAHYVKDGEARDTVRIGRPHGPCGTFSVRRRQFPFRPAVGAWTVQIDQLKSFAATPASPFVRLPITVRRVADYR